MLSVLFFSHTDTMLVRLYISTRSLLYSEPPLLLRSVRDAASI
jgi:hypothetical protein